MEESQSTASVQDLSPDQRLSMAMYEIREVLRDVNMNNSSNYLAAVSQLYAKNRVMAQEYARINSVSDNNTAAARLGDVVDRSIEILHTYGISRQESAYIIKKLDAVQASDTGG